MTVPALPTFRRALTPRERLEQQPERFSLDQAVAVLAPGRDPVDLPYRCSTSLAAPGGEVGSAGLPAGELVTPTFGLVGPGGVLPRHYTALVDAQGGRRGSALRDLLDLLSRRMTGLFVKAGQHSRPMRSATLANEILSASIGLATPHLVDRLELPLAAVLYHAGGLAGRSRSAERLRGMLAEETGSSVTIEEFAGGWLSVPSGEQSRLPALGQTGQYHRLGVDAALGARTWDASARFLIRLGPLDWPAFCSLLPGQPLHRRLVALTRLHVGLEQQFAFAPALKGDALPPFRLGRAGAPTGAAAGMGRLGWTSWLGAPGRPPQDRKDTLFGATAPPDHPLLHKDLPHE